MLVRLFAGLLLALAVPTLGLASEQPSQQPGFTDTRQDQTAKAYYLLQIKGTQRGELSFESEVSVVDGFWAEIQCGDTKEILTYVAMKFGNGGVEFDYQHTPSEIIPLLRHLRAGDLEAWYYVPNSDQVEITWSRTDLAGTILNQDEVSLTNRAANIASHEPEYTPDGSITLSL